MSTEAIFDFDIDRILKEKLSRIMIMPGSIEPQNYERLGEILKADTNLESVLVSCVDGGDKFWENFFKIFRKENGEFNIDPSKITLNGDPTRLNLDIFQYIENLELPNSVISHIEDIESKFPNLKNIVLTSGTAVSYLDITADDVDKVFRTAKYMKVMNLIPMRDRRIEDRIEPLISEEYLKVNGLSDKFILSKDRKCLINLDKIGEKSEYPKKLTINLSDLSKINLEELRSSGDEITLLIDSANDLSVSQIQEYQNSGLEIKNVKIYSPENSMQQNEPYNLQTYIAVREKLDELVEGIDLNLPEKQRFAEVYKRICKNITYDVPAAYPKNGAEEKYEIEQLTNSRNLINGLLAGRCVCAGYADILRNALAMVNIEAQYTEGCVVDKEIPEEKFNEQKDGKKVYKRQDGKVILGDGHAWNKVKLDGVWYNVDSTWDATRVRLEQAPKHCLKTDDEIEREEKKTDFEGPDCETEVEKREVEELFGIRHLYIGKFQVPNTKDIISIIKQTGYVYKGIGIAIKKAAVDFGDKIAKTVQNGKNLRIDAPNPRQALNSNKMQDNENPWGLENWGINPQEFREGASNIASKSTQKNGESINVNSNDDRGEEEVK